MNLEDITQIGVVGAGTMGAGIAELFAEAGYEVIWYNRSEAGIQRGLARIQSNQVTLIRHGILTQMEADTALARLHPTTDMVALASVDLISESVPEELKLKQDLFSALAQCCRPETIFTTDSSGIPISEIATSVSFPARFAGMHFANPPHIMPLAEIIKGEQTSEITCELLIALARRLGKSPIFARKDVPGFIAARLLCAVIREALHLLEAGIAAPADIDAAVKHGLGLRWAFLGPLELVDLGGVDVLKDISSYLFEALSDTKQTPQILHDMTSAGKFGVKSGVGFYEYPAGHADTIIADRDEKLLQLLQLKQA